MNAIDIAMVTIFLDIVMVVGGVLGVISLLRMLLASERLGRQTHGKAAAVWFVIAAGMYLEDILLAI